MPGVRRVRDPLGGWGAGGKLDLNVEDELISQLKLCGDSQAEEQLQNDSTSEGLTHQAEEQLQNDSTSEGLTQLGLGLMHNTHSAKSF